MDVETIYFCMPLVGRSASSDWNRVCLLLDQTLKSILVQSGNIKVLVACNEIPNSSLASDSRLSFLSIQGHKPQTLQERRQDKSKKLRRLIEEVRARGPGYVILMDADDLISNRLVDYIRTSNNKNGYLFQSGYLLNVAGKRFRKTRNFPTHCGTCAAFYLSHDDLAPGREICAIMERGRHTRYAEACEKMGRTLEKVPFPVAIYVRHHGENISRVKHYAWTLTVRDFLRRLIPLGRINGRIRSEFSVPSHY